MRKLENLEAKYWGETLLCHPEHENKCPWEKLNAATWHALLMEHPEYICHAPEKITPSFMNTRQWLEVLIRHPELEKYLPDPNILLENDSEVIGRLWGILLSRNPEFSKYKPWKLLRRRDWRRLLSQQPQFMTNYNNDRYLAHATQLETLKYTLGSVEQAAVIACQPSLFDRFHTRNYSSKSWVLMLTNQPQLREKCKLHDPSVLTPEDLGFLLKRHPDWLAYCETYSRTPEDILRIATAFPEIINHYDLEKIKNISYRDTPWMEVFPALVPYSHWNFSYSYWDALLTRLSTWFTTGKRPRISSFFKNDDTPATSRRKITRHLPLNPKERSIRNSVDSILEYLFWYGLSSREERMSVVPKNIKEFVMDETMSYEQMMIQMRTMKSSAENGLILYALFLQDDVFLSTILEDRGYHILDLAPVHALLPLALLFVSKPILKAWLYEIHKNDAHAIARFKDKAGNNALHYYFFHGNWDRGGISSDYYGHNDFNPDPFNYDFVQILLDYGVNPDKPNKMGFSYNQIKEAMDKYLRIK